MRAPRFAALMLSICLLAACAHTSAKVTLPTPTPSPSPIDSPSPTPSVDPSPVTTSQSHVFVIVMENHSYGRALTGSYTAALAKKYSVATDYHDVGNPSLPNYLALTSGSTWGIADDGYHRLPAGGIGAQLTSAGILWRAYMEGMTNGCFGSPYPYALKHNPFAYYGGGCPSQVVNFSHFAADMGALVPNFVWVTPGLCHDGHDCSTATADQWLSHTVPLILATDAWKNNGLLLITWDEGDGSDNHVLTLAIQPNAVDHTSARSYNHYSLLATIEDRLGLARLGKAADSSAMTDLVTNPGP
ncbi:MAG TPA: alkaline phosphatase family protein [Candidatus Dormibacteraeota bacterium]|nr:alkaline phosphatase family protein [Candidatus Dormibacteraeota bacterium]